MMAAGVCIEACSEMSIIMMCEGSGDKDGDSGPCCTKIKNQTQVPKIKRKSEKSNVSQKIKRNFAFDFFSVAQKLMFDIKHKYQTQVSKIKRNFMP